MTHTIQCRCGSLKGLLSQPRRSGRGVCYCADCRSFAHFLGQADSILDAQGGTHVISTRQGEVRFTQGQEQLACMSLSPKGLLRWYARCCRTPIGNTPRNYKVSHVGLVHNCLQGPGATLDQAFGPVRMRVNTDGATAPVAPMRLATFFAVLGFLTRLMAARLNGSYRQTAFFDPATGKPVVEPEVLTREQRESLRAAA